MAYCRKCGAHIDDGADACGVCGRKRETENKEMPCSAEDAKRNMVLGILSYIGILFLIPLLAAKKSQFAQFHAKQGMKVAILQAAYIIAFFVITAIGNSIPFINVITKPFLILGMLLLPLFNVFGILFAAKKRMNKLPIIDKFKF